MKKLSYLFLLAAVILSSAIVSSCSTSDTAPDDRVPSFVTDNLLEGDWFMSRRYKLTDGKVTEEVTFSPSAITNGACWYIYRCENESRHRYSLTTYYWNDNTQKWREITPTFPVFDFVGDKMIDVATDKEVDYKIESCDKTKLVIVQNWSETTLAYYEYIRTPLRSCFEII